jgi:hypothetical protein
MAPLTVPRGMTHHSRAVELSWLKWDAEKAGGGSEASVKAHDTASATAKRDYELKKGMQPVETRTVRNDAQGFTAVQHKDSGKNMGMVIKDGGRYTAVNNVTGEQTHHDTEAGGVAQLSQMSKEQIKAAKGVKGGGASYGGRLGSAGISTVLANSNQEGITMAPVTAPRGVTHQRMRDLLFAGDDGGAEGAPSACPNCGFDLTKGDGSASSSLRTPDATPDVRSGAATDVRGASSGNLGLASQYRGIELAARAPAVRNASEIMVTRGEGGVAIIRHRRGGGEIGRITRTDQGWQAEMEGVRGLEPRVHQRTALADILGTHNRNAGTELHRPAESLQPPAVQTPLMAQYGIQNVRAFATSASGSGDGPRTTMAGGGTDENGLTPKGQGIYKKLKAKGFPDARALQFAKRAQSFGGASS